MPRVKGSGTMGSVRSLRLPRALDEWFEGRLRDVRDRSASEMLLELIHGGLRLRRGYMARQRQKLEQLVLADDGIAFNAYRDALCDTFDSQYTAHIEAWLRSDGVLKTTRELESPSGPHSVS